MSRKGKRRRWTASEKLGIVLAGMESGVEVSELCRRAGFTRHILFEAVLDAFQLGSALHCPIPVGIHGYPGGAVGCCRYLARTASAFPETQAGRLPQHPFSRPAQRSLAFRPAWSLSHLKVTRYTRVLQQHSLPPVPLWLLPAERPIGRVGFAPTGDRRLSRHTGYLTRFRIRMT